MGKALEFSWVGVWIVCVGLTQNAHPGQASQASVSTVETAQEADGPSDQEILDGKYELKSEDGDRLVSGEHANGLREGTWRFWDLDGDLRIKAKYEGGQRVGKWEFYWSDKQVLAKGSYSKGQQQGSWSYFDPNGEPSVQLSGKYKWIETKDDRKRVTGWGPTLDGRLHGKWTFVWPEGTLRLVGEYKRGVRSGSWFFWHRNGAFDAEFLSGEYAPRRFDAPLQAEPLEWGAWEEALELWRSAANPVEIEPAQPESEQDSPSATEAQELQRQLEALPNINAQEEVTERGLPSYRVSDDDREAAQRLVTNRLQAIKQADTERPASNLGELVKVRSAALLNVIRELGSLNLEDAEQAQRAFELERLILAPLSGGFSYGFVGAASSEQGVTQNELTRQRWLSLLHHTEDRGVFWELRTVVSDGSPAAFAEQSFWRPRSPEEATTALSSKKPDKLFFGKTNVGEQVDQALAWLALQQDSDGAFRLNDIALCDQPESFDPQTELGRTALCLLAFVRAGNSLEQGLYSPHVLAAVRYLISMQDKEGWYKSTRWVTDERGRTRKVQVAGHSIAYEQAIATLALAELLKSSDLPMLRSSVTAAVGAIESARNPYGAWRYNSPPTGDNDTSVTGWMVYALLAANQRGISTEERAFADTMRWIDEVTDPETGRVGYDSVGSLSARIHHINDEFPRELSEAMTAIGLRLRNLLEPEQAEIKLGHQQLLNLKMPTWGVHSCDFYYWYHGKLALGADSAWAKELLKALLANQVSEGPCSGSWEPVGPWCTVGGRIYSTAMGTLCLLPPGLEAPYEHHADKKKRRR